MTRKPTAGPPPEPPPRPPRRLPPWASLLAALVFVALLLWKQACW